MSKLQLKHAREAINAKDYYQAVELCERYLEAHPTDYNALVIFGLGKFNLGFYVDCEEAYRKALSINESAALAWQGLQKLYEQQNDAKNLIKVYEALLEIHYEEGSEEKCLNLMENLIALAKAKGTEEDIIAAMSLQLPDSKYYTLLEHYMPDSCIPLTYMIDYVEKNQSKAIDTGIAKRRLKLGAILSQVTSEVQWQVYKNSVLFSLYRKLISWAFDDDLRRQTEKKLLYLLLDSLYVAPVEEKTRFRESVLDIANGLILMQDNDKIAWMVVLEWQDVEELSLIDQDLARNYVKLNNDDPLSKIFCCYFQFETTPHTIEKRETDFKSTTVNENIIEISNVDFEDMYNNIANAVVDLPSSWLAKSIFAKVALQCHDYEVAADVSTDALRRIEILEKQIGINLPKARKLIITIKATAYIYYQSPKNHPLACRLFDDILHIYTTDLAALVGISKISLAHEKYQEALEYLEKAYQVDSNNTSVLSELGWVQVLLKNFETGKTILERAINLMEVSKSSSKDFAPEIWWRLGHCNWEMEHCLEAYANWANALKYNPNMAKVYTSLGYLYQESVCDHSRAFKCFTRAFELDATEIDAAHELALSFAARKEWDFVEIVAKRVSSVKTKFAVSGKWHSWPYRAIGIVELRRRNYAKSIAAFHSALRISPEDEFSWIGLGEAYKNSGRLAAAEKVFTKIYRYTTDEHWYPLYLLGEVFCARGNYEAATKVFYNILANRPTEYCVLVALASNLMQFAYSCLRNANLKMASELAVETEKVARNSILELQNSICWTFLADSYELRLTVNYHTCTKEVSSLITKLKAMASSDDIVLRGFLTQLLDKSDSDISIVEMCLLSRISCILLTNDDRHANASAYYNLGISALNLSRQHLCEGKVTLRLSLHALKLAIQFEPRNQLYWSAYITAAALANKPRLAEKAAIRALRLNPKDAATWSNVATFLLHYNDEELSALAVQKSQTLDPLMPQTWLLRALLEQSERSAFKQAYELSTSNNVTVNLLYAQNVLGEVRARTGLIEESYPEILSALFALEKVDIMAPKLHTSLLTKAFLFELLHDEESALSVLLTLKHSLEDLYETTEESELICFLCRVRIATSRLQLILGQYDEALESSTFALNFLSEYESMGKERICGLIIVGLCHYFRNQYSDALEVFQSALNLSNEDPKVALLVAQCLWAIGEKDEKEVATEQLRQCFQQHPEDVSILLAFAATLQGPNDESYEEVMLALNKARIADTNLKADLEFALTNLSTYKNMWQSAIFLHPADGQIWKAAAEDLHDPCVAQSALHVGQGKNGLSANDMSILYILTGIYELIQRAIFLAPWNETLWPHLISTKLDAIIRLNDFQAL